MNRLMIDAVNIMHTLQHEGLEPYFVGGCVRDGLMGRPIKDVDVEVFGGGYDSLAVALHRIRMVRKISTVGKAFGILRVTTDNGEIDFSVPRRDNRVGVGHKGFECEFDPNITPEEAALRRDFTMNSMFEDMHGTVYDPWGGKQDIKDRILRATSPAFEEDALRVLRGMQFASRFDMRMDLHTVRMCTNMIDNYADLPVERVWMEWKKWALGAVPSAGLRVLVQTGWIGLYPELDMLRGVQQDPEWHPEGDVWKHTMRVVDAAAKRAMDKSDDDRLVIVFSALLHDVGKAATTELRDGRWRSPQHAPVGVPLAEDFLHSIGAPHWLIEKVKPLVREHMVHVGLTEPTPRVVRRLATRLEPANIDLLRAVVFADEEGRPPLVGTDKLASWVEMAKDLKVDQNKPDRILMGRHLLAAGLDPGPQIGKILEEAYSAQLDGEFEDLEGAMEWAKYGMGSQWWH